MPKTLLFTLAFLLPITSLGCTTISVNAKFHLGTGPVLVLIDDVGEHVDWPAAKQYLWNDLSQELLRNKAAVKVVPNETLESLRRTMPDFDKRGARELGESAGADQIIWIETQNFLAEEQITEAQNAAYWAVTVKVVNAREKENRTRVRVWPDSPEGEYITVGMTGAAVIGEKTKDSISKVLSAKLSVRISRLFYDHKIEQAEEHEQRAAAGLSVPRP